MVHALDSAAGGASDGGALLDYVFELVTWDGTKQKLSLNFHPMLGVDQQTSSWEVFVSSRTLLMGRGANHLVMELMVPPIPSLGTDADTAN
jgi:hypothetical protein